MVLLSDGIVLDDSTYTRKNGQSSHETSISFRSASLGTGMSKPAVFATRSRESFPTPMLDKVGE